MAVGVRSSEGQTLWSPGGAHASPGSGAATGSLKDTMEYGERSRFVTSRRARMAMIGNMDMHRDPNGWDARTPLDQMLGILTPASLHYVSSHGNPPPDIDPRAHRLILYGMVERPMVLTLDELMRFPSVSRVHFIECIYNAPSPRATTLEQNHGMISCSEWTGVPLSVLLSETGVKRGASWILAEGADATKHAKSVPIAKAMSDVLVAYGQNGEPVRPHQGYPLRLIVPGFEGKFHVKWLKGIKVVNEPYLTYWEQGAFVKDPKTSGSYYMEQGPKSVITFPSGGQRLTSRGFYTINGFAWSGGGAVRRVEVSVDGGRTWTDAQLPEPPLRIALTRFQLPWTWDGKETMLQSRCTDDTGSVQPTLADHAKFWGISKAPHGNAIQPWKVTSDGQVLNAL